MHYPRVMKSTWFRESYKFRVSCSFIAEGGHLVWNKDQVYNNYIYEIENVPFHTATAVYLMSYFRPSSTE